jgi:hypothetical protein
MKRARTQSRRLAAVTTAVLPEEILVWEIFVRLPAKYVIRCRAVCRYWYNLTSTHDFLLTHHQRQPSLLLLTLEGHSTDPFLGLTSDAFGRDPIIVRGLPSPVFLHAHDRRRWHGHPILGFDDYNGSRIHSSCDGLLLLLSLPDGRSIIYNPATRECVALSGQTAAGRVRTAALYLHRPSKEYRVLYRNRLEDDYYILTVQQRRSPRCIGESLQLLIHLASRKLC